MLPVVFRRILGNKFRDALTRPSIARSLTSGIQFKFKATLPLHRHCSSFQQTKENEDALEKPNESIKSDVNKPSPSFDGDFLPFKDGEKTIQDVNDDEWDPVPQPDVLYDPIERINLARGKTGVFDVGELVELLQEEKAYDACVITVPKEMKYVDHLVIVTARSHKHLQAVATFVRRVFKRKERNRFDLLPTIEKGKMGDDDWIALDLGNIALHIFTWVKREEVDLETLWLVGPEYDDLTNQKDSEIITVLDTFSASHHQLDTQKANVR